jgi:hypothetical protein
MTKAALETLVNALLAPAQPITANGMHKPSMQKIMDELYDAQSRGNVLSGVGTSVSLTAGDLVLVIRSGSAFLLDAALFAGGAAADFVDEEVPSGTINSANTIFILANTPIVGSVKVFLNGIRMKATVDYNISGATITFVTAPTTGDSLLSDYRK